MGRGGFAGGAPQSVTTAVPTQGTVTSAQQVNAGSSSASASGTNNAAVPNAAGGVRRRESRAAGAARLFGYLEASDGSGDEYEPPPLPAEFGGTQHYTRDKENAAPPPLHHALHHDHCLRY